MFCLNILSNISAHYNGGADIQDSTVAAITRTLGNSAVQNLIGNWQLVWGPYVYVGNDTARNTMYIAQKQNTDTFVVAIAGTDPASVYDWVWEDFDVLPRPWKWGSGEGMITMATATGMENLNLLGAGGKPGDSLAFQVIAARAQKTPNMQLWVTGHSLGGALSPAYALYLHDNMGKKDWAPNAKVNINVLAVAGATPGDSVFTAYYDSVLGPTTRRVWNMRDVVPHGFAHYMLEEIPTLYPSDSVNAMPWLLQKGVQATELTVGNMYRQLMPSVNDSFTSCIYTTDSIKNKKSSFSEKNFADQAMFQHIPSYAVYFNILGFQQAVQAANNLPYPFFSQGAIQVPVY